MYLVILTFNESLLVSSHNLTLVITLVVLVISSSRLGPYKKKTTIIGEHQGKKFRVKIW